MPRYRYQATDAFGATVNGSYVASSEQEVRIFLRQSGLVPTTIKRSLLHGVELRVGSGVKRRDVIIFTQMMAAMLQASVPMDRTLRTLARQATNPVLKAAILRMQVDVESGSTLSGALRRHPGIFSPIYCNMVAAGEASGSVPLLLERLADMLERTEAVRSKVRGAMIYPSALLTLGVLAVAALLVFVLPEFIAVFDDAGVPLPGPTRLSIAVSEALKAWGLHMMGLMLMAVLVVRRMLKVAKYSVLFDNMLLRLPAIGGVLVKGASARFARTFSTLVSSGVPVVEGLGLVADTAGNAAIARVVEETRRAVSEGSDIATPLDESGYFPPLLTSMVAIGEESGELSGMLERIANFLESDVNQAVDTTLKLIEPLLLVFLGGLVAFVMLSMYLPMFDMLAVIDG